MGRAERSLVRKWEKGKKNLEFYPSNLTPLWTGCFSDPSVIDKALKYLEVRGQWAGLASGRQAPPFPAGSARLSLQISLRPLGAVVRQEEKGR